SERARRGAAEEAANAALGGARDPASGVGPDELCSAGRGRSPLLTPDWTRYRDRLAALRAMGEAGFRALVGV
ncbi:MAG TPA: homoserine kinase, partial [Anaeromyxobacteraceae bacterium]